MKSILLWIVLLLCITQLKAQNSTPSPAPAKVNVKLVFEKTYLHTDRDIYAQGDTLWFKAYLVNGQDNKLVNSSNTLYVELLAPDSARIIDREIIRLDNGLGNGDISLADSLPPGKYRLRAYTNWMRNFGDNFVFEKYITILNTTAVPEVTAAAKDKAPVPQPKKKTKADAAVTTINTIIPTLRFYPEGGSLVQGISSIVAVKAEDGYGKGNPVTGTVLSSAGDTVSRFSCDSLGMGLFALLPVTGQTYHALWGQKQITELPAALTKGPVLMVRQTDSVIHAIISTNDITANPGYLIAVKHAGLTVLSQQLQITGPQLSVKIAPAELPEGISAITLYDSQGKPNCERLVYIHHAGSVSSGGGSISTNKKVYKAKEQVTVNISTKPNSNLSMAVVDAGLVPEQADDIVAYLKLSSEIKGNVEQAHRYFDTTNVNRYKQLDLLLMTQGWRDFIWRRLADTAIRISYAAENGIPVSGKVRDELLNKMLPNLNLTVYASGAKGNKIFTGKTDPEGRFSLPGLVMYGDHPVKLTAVNDEGKNKGSFMMDTLLPLPVKPMIRKPAALQAADDSVIKTAVEKRISTIKKANINGVTKLREVKIKGRNSIMTQSGNFLTSFGPEQSFTIKPEDEKYKTLEWYILQNVKGAMQSSPPGPTGVVFSGVDTLKDSLPGLGGGARIVYRGRTTLMPPQIFINGQELYMQEFNQAEAYRSTYFNMAITKFKKVVLKRMVGSLHGLSAAGGSLDPTAQMVMVDRYLLYLTVSENAMIDNPGSVNAIIPGYYEARTFYQPLPNARPSLADYRTTIHWAPNIKTDATGKVTASFYNSVPTAGVRVIVEGIAGDGTAINSTTLYETK